MGYAEQWELPLDRGISYAVKVLRDSGIETFESCVGGEGHAFLEPTVRFHGGPEVGFMAVSFAMKHGLPVADLRRYWEVIDGEPHGPHWEMTFAPVSTLLQVEQRAEQAGLLGP